MSCLGDMLCSHPIYYFPSMFLQNMAVVSQSSTVKCILKQHKNDERPEVLSALIAMTKSNSADASSTVNIFGLLINVSLHSKGAKRLKNLGFHVEEYLHKENELSI